MINAHQLLYTLSNHSVYSTNSYLTGYNGFCRCFTP